MSAPDVTDRIVEAIENGRFDAIIVNYANGDMVGHTGILAAAIKAAETIDSCLARLEAALKKAGGTTLVCADHGNLELMKDPATHEPHTQHTVGVVPAVLVNGPAGVDRLRNGRLADIAPTVLELLKLPKPAEMTGTSLLVREADAQTQRRLQAVRARNLFILPLAAALAAVPAFAQTPDPAQLKAIERDLKQSESEGQRLANEANAATRDVERLRKSPSISPRTSRTRNIRCW